MRERIVTQIKNSHRGRGWNIFYDRLHRIIVKVTLTGMGKVENSPVGTLVNVLLLKSIVSTKAAMADTFPELINDWI